MQLAPTRLLGCLCVLIDAAAQAADARVFRSSIDMVGLTVTQTRLGLVALGFRTVTA
jgi:hypothetical protein